MTKQPIEIMLLTLGYALIAAPGAWAQTDVDIEVPTIVLEEFQAQEGTASEELDLANIVQTAAKGVTTVQEAPAIITIITEEEIEQRGLQTVEHVVDTVPGWLRLAALNGQFPFGLTRGTLQASLFMVDGVSMFDPIINTPSLHRVFPIERVKRIEMITGPGGVLWGANSFMGIINVVTKDAEDVDGVEAKVLYGNGNGDRDVFRGYVMAGITDLFSSDASLLLHTSFDSYLGPGYELPLHMFSTPLPQPNSELYYGPLTQANPPRSFAFNLGGKLRVGDATVEVSVPFAERQSPIGFPGTVIQEDLPEDTLRDPETGELLCPFEEPYFDPTDQCIDKGRRARENEITLFDRYVVGRYQRRFASGRAGIDIKTYGVQFARLQNHIGITAPVPSLLEGGISTRVPFISYRVGTSIDNDIELPSNARLLLGVEAFHEWLRETAERTRQGPGIESSFPGPYQLERLPLPCPQRINEVGEVEYLEDCPLTITFPASRTVLGAYLNPQWHLTEKLILDGGARVQAAPDSLGKLGYDTETTVSGALVYAFIPNWHVKLNYAQGFRPPVFQNLVSNGESVTPGGRPGLETERSQAWQSEVNARIFKGQRRIRELNFRADYSYTRLDNLIQIQQGRYENVGDRDIHSAELLGKLYIEGGHFIELGYTWLQISTADKGRFRAMPEHWFNLVGAFEVTSKLRATTGLRVLGAQEDANRLVEYRDWTYNDRGRVINPQTQMEGYLVVQPHELVLDRLPPGAEATFGVAYAPMQQLLLEAWAYNAFNARYYQPDAFFDYEPRLEFLPNPYEDVRFTVGATYSY